MSAACCSTPNSPPMRLSLWFSYSPRIRNVLSECMASTCAAQPAFTQILRLAGCVSPVGLINPARRERANWPGRACCLTIGCRFTCGGDFEGGNVSVLQHAASFGPRCGRPSRCRGGAWRPKTRRTKRCVAHGVSGVKRLTRKQACARSDLEASACTAIEMFDARGVGRNEWIM